MNEQIGIDVKFGDRNMKAYQVSQFANKFHLRAIYNIRISQSMPSGTISIDTDIDCGMLEKENLQVDDVGFVEMNNKKYILLEIKPKKIT